MGKIITGNCAYCHKPFSYASRPGTKRKYCSDECRRMYWKWNYDPTSRLKSIHVNTYTCKRCGKVFKRYTSPNYKYNPSYCSRDCYIKTISK
jgi:hypothetical protein